MSSDVDVLKLEMRPFVKRSFTTAPGATPANNTLIDATLTEPNDFWNGMAILIRTGACAGELRRILDYDLGTTTLTVNVAFSAQIVAGVQYVMTFPYSDPEVVAIEAKLDDPDHGLVEIKSEVANIETAVAPARGTTSADGLPGGTTVVDTARTEPNDHWNTMALLITSGTQSGQVREIVTWVLGTGTFTVLPAFGGQILNGVTYKILTNLPADIDVAVIEALLGTLVDAEAEAGAVLPRLLWLKNALRRGTGTILPVNTSLYDFIAGIIADIGVFPTANYASLAVYVEDIRARLVAILADMVTIAGYLDTEIQSIIDDIGVFPTANYASVAAYVEDVRTRLTAILTETESHPTLAEIQAGDMATILADVAEGKERRWKETYIYETEYEQISNAGEESVTPPTGISPVFPAGATLRRATLVAALKANNDTAALHKIGVTLQYQIAGGGWNDLIDLTANPTLMLPEVEGTGDAITIVEDMIGLFTSGQLVEVQFLVDSTNAAAVNYMTTFVLSLEFDLV